MSYGEDNNHPINTCECGDVSGSTKLEEMPSQIGNLTNLQTFSEFILSKGIEELVESPRSWIMLWIRKMPCHVCGYEGETQY